MKQQTIIISFFALCLWLTSCAIFEVQGLAEKGEESLKQCEFTKASQYFEEAYDIHQNHAELSLGYGIAAIFGILASEDIKTLLQRLGFSGDFEQLCRSRQNLPTDCRTPFPEYLLAHPCDRQTDCDFARYIDETLTWEEIRLVMEHHLPALEKAANALAYAATEFKSNYSITSFFDDQALSFHPADIYFAAASLELVVALLKTSRAYRWDFSVMDSFLSTIKKKFHNPDIFVMAMIDSHNNNLFVLQKREVDASATRNYRDAFSWINKTMTRAYKMVEMQESSGYIQWHTLPYGVVSDLIAFSAAMKKATPDLSTVVFPYTDFQYAALRKNPPHRSAANPIVKLQGKYDDDGNIVYYLDWDFEEFVVSLNNVLKPPIFDASSNHYYLRENYDLRLSSGWRRFEPKALWPKRQSSTLPLCNPNN